MKKERVAVYCRVSTEHVEQDQSYQAQIQYFTEKFSGKYDIVEVYADKGSGLSIKKRPQFQKMLIDAGLDIEERKGKINTYLSNRAPQFKYILTKSVSRFSRNSEIISIIRDLKSRGVYIVFDDINKTTESQEDTMLLEFLQSISQEESRNKSQIVKWGKKRSAENGKVHLGAKIYGYEQNVEENTLKVIPEEAKIVQMIFRLAEENNGVRRIKRILTEKGLYNREGKPFSEHHLMYMLKNPKYTGVNVRNRFEKVDLYNSNKQVERDEDEWIIQETDKIDKIIEKEQFEKVQGLISSRSTAKKGVNIPKGDLAQKILCSCGSYYIRNKETYKSGKTRLFYNCSRKRKQGAKTCSSRNLDSKEVEKLINIYRKNMYKTELEKYQKKLISKLDNRKLEILNKKNNDNSKEVEYIKSKIAEHEYKLNELIGNMIDNSSETLKKVYTKKIEEIENEVKQLEKTLSELQADEDKINEVINNIEEMKEVILKFQAKENMTREEFLEELLYIEVKEDELVVVTKNLKYMLECYYIIEGKTELVESKKEITKEKLIKYSSKLKILVEMA